MLNMLLVQDKKFRLEREPSVLYRLICLHLQLLTPDQTPPPVAPPLSFALPSCIRPRLHAKLFVFILVLIFTGLEG